MNEITSYDTGEFCWTNLGTPNVEAAKKFYSAIFGWEYRDVASPFGAMAICHVGGKDICAIYPKPEDEKQAQIPPNWMAYVSVADIEAEAKKVKSSGGKVLHGPADANEAGRFAVIQDPTGAVFALWQAKNHRGAAVGGVVGSVCWRELTTPNVDAAYKFYHSLFNWTSEARQGAGMVYHMLSLGEEGVGGMLAPPQAGIPPHWLTYFIVNDAGATGTKVKSLRGEVIVPPTPVPGMGRFSILRDPQGAAFGIFDTIQ